MVISTNKIWEVADSGGEPIIDFFTMHSEPIPQPQSGELLTRATLICVDLLTVSSMLESGQLQSHRQTWRLPGSAVAEVIESRDLATPPGSLVQSDEFGWQEYAVLKANRCIRVDPSIAPAEAWLSYLGRPGLTAWLALNEIGRLRPGETVLIDDAADGVGQLGGQLVKAYGGRSVALVSSEEKRQWCQEIGYDAVIDTQAVDNLPTALRNVAPDGIDVVLVTGRCAHHRVVEPMLNESARVILSGNQRDSVDDDGELISNIYRKSSEVNGVSVSNFTLSQHADRYDEARTAIAAIASEEKFDYLFDVIDGIKSLPDALIRLRSGLTVGKQLVKL